MTSAVTSTPRALAARTTSTEPRVDRWQTCSREPTCWASRQSRAMTASSATLGQPARPSRAETSPSFIWAPSVRRGSCACWAITPSKALTYSSARRISSGSLTQTPSSLKTRTRAAESAIAPSSASCSPAQADGDGPDRVHVAVAGVAAEPVHLLDHAGEVGDRVGVRHRVHRGEPAQRGGPGAGLDRLGVLAARLAQVGVQVDQARAARPARRRRRTSASAAARPAPIAAITPSASSRSVGSPPRTRPRRGRGSAVIGGPPGGSGRRSGSGRPGRPAPAGRSRRRASAPPRSRYSTAIRTLTPLATCSTMVERTESATSEAISMPRFIGPGCITTACSGSAAIRLGVEAVAAAVLARRGEEGALHPLALHPQHHHHVALGQRPVEVVARPRPARRRRPPAAASAAPPG